MVGRGGTWLACVTVSVLAGGCDLLFRIDQVPAGPSDAHHDATATDAKHTDASIDATDSRSKCPNANAPLFDYTFDASPTSGICTPWGSAYSDPGVTVTQTGSLTIVPNSAGSAVGGCTQSSATNLGSSVTVVVNSVVTGGSAYNVFEIHTVDYEITQAGGLLTFEDASNNVHGSVTYNTSMKYWRIAVTSTGLTGEYSTDGSIYTLLGSVAITPPTTGKVELSVGTNTAGGQNVAQFDELYICP